MKRFARFCLGLATLAIGCSRAQPASRVVAPGREQGQPDAAAAVEAAGSMQSITNSIGMKLVMVPAGEFLMGSPDSDEEVRDDERPQHRVRITRSFYMGVYEVTQAEYGRVMERDPGFFSNTGPAKDRLSDQNTGRFPIEQVSWYDAVEFCRRLSDLPAEKQAGRVYRLPTEAQWEYACRAGTTTTFHFGDSLTSTDANMNGNYPYGSVGNGPFLVRTTEVGSYAPNAFGLYDMHGNVWEWCADRYGADYYRVSEPDDPRGPPTGSNRAIRGGCWRSDGRDCRSAFRYADTPHGRYYVTGLRVVMTTHDDATSGELADSRAPQTQGASSVTGELAASRKRGAGGSPADSLAERAGGPPAPRLTTSTGAAEPGEEWPRWRGPRGDGTWIGPKLPAQWPEAGLRRLWRQPIGGGHAGVVGAQGRVYTMDRPPAPGDKTSGEVKANEVERVLCFDAHTGKPLWSHEYPANYGDMEYGNGPRATPTVHDGLVYSLGAVGHLFCLDAATGTVVWSKDLVADHDARRPLWGFAGSPVVFEDLVIVHAGAEPDGCLIAFDRRTGDEVWRSLPDEAGYATPIVIEAHGRQQLVCWTAKNVRGLDPRTGELVWTIPFEVTYGTAIATPSFQENILLVSGYWEGAQAIRLGSDPGDVSVVWEDRRDLRALMSQPIYRDGYSYLLDKRHGLTCFEHKTGKKLWDDGNRMTPKGRNPQATLVWLGDGDRAIALNSDGELILARLNPQGYHEEPRTSIIGPTWAHPAYAGSCVFARNDTELVSVSLIEPVVAQSQEQGRQTKDDLNKDSFNRDPAGRADGQQQQPKDDPNKDYKDELPRIPPKEPDAAIQTFKLQPGFRIEQVAAEPLVTDPIALAFDENGRLFVVEMKDYSEQADDRLGLIRLLEDSDGDGRFDRSTVYLDELSWPTAVICYDGGVFVGAAPDILYAKDTDGDGRADVRQVVFTGFERSNVQGLMNSFQWGLDNRIHGATSSSGASVRRVREAEATPLVLRGRDFAFDPRTLNIEATSGGAQHGMCFDDWGRRFVCSNSDHIQLVMFEDRYVARNPHLIAPGPRASIAADGPQAEVFRSSPIEPWRIVRTRLRVAGMVPGPIEGGGRPAGYFTSATGITIYRGDAWPEPMRGLAIVGDVGSNIVHRKRLEADGVGLVARRIDEKSEFVASGDIWFRPVQFANAPDGALYIADMYREVIEHPLSLPPIIKKHLDLTSGRDRGRIYRIVSEEFKQRKPPRLGQASSEELVSLLAHPNGWHRDTAARLLHQRQDRTAIEPLRKLSADSPSPLGRMHALYALDGLGALSAEAILARLDDEHPRVREHAVRLAERIAGDSPEVQAKLLAIAGDADLLVRYQLAFTLGELSGQRRNAALVELAERDAGDRWVRLAILSSLGEGSSEVFGELMDKQPFRSTQPGRELLETLAAQAGAGNRQDEVAAVLRGIDSLPGDEAELAQRIVRGLSTGLAKTGNALREALARSSNGRAGKLLEELLAAARKAASDESRPPAERAEAIRTLGLGRFADMRPVLASLLDNRQPQEVQLAVLAALGRFPEPDVASLVLNVWPQLSPRLRAPATEVIFARPERLAALLDAVANQQVGVAELDPARIKLLLGHSDAAIRQRAEQLFASVKLGRRQDVVDAYRPALELAGDLQRGRLAFRKVCAACHKLEGVGHELAPSLGTIQNRGAEAILLNVLDPNREVNPQYLNYVVATKDGRTFTGMITAETATSVTLTRAEAASDTVLRIDIDELRSTGISIMPEGMEKDIDHQTMADLIAYLLSIQ